MADTFVSLHAVMADSTLAVATSSDLPAQGLIPGSLRYVVDSSTLYTYNGSSWVPVTVSAVTANRVLVSDSGGLPSASSVSTTTLGYLDATSSIQTQLNAKIASSEKAAANGVATLDSTTKIPQAQLPAIAITDTSVVASQVAMLALTAQTGDVAIRTDLNKCYILAGTDPTVLSDWKELLTPTDTVLSVNGQTGSVSLSTSDITEGTNLYFTDERAQDAIAAALTASSTISFTYTDVANTISASIVSDSITNAMINTAAAIARSKIANGTADHVLINNGTGGLSSEAQLDRTRGGTGISSTATFPSSGVVVTEAASEILTNKTIDGDDNTVQDLPVTSLKTDAANADKAVVGTTTTGVPKFDYIKNVNVDAAAAITYSKLALSNSIDLDDIKSGDKTGTGTKVVTDTSPDINTSARLLAQGVMKFADSDSSNFIGLKAPATVAADKTFILPDADGSVGQVLKTDGSLNLGWASAVTNPMTAAQDLIVGGTAGAANQLSTSLLGYVSASATSTTVTITIATPGVVTHSSHGLALGDKIYLTTTGALPTGLSVNTTYYVIKIDANSYNLATSLANAIAGTKIATSGSQSGTHTCVSGGIQYTNIKGDLTGTAVPTGYIGEKITWTSAPTTMTVGTSEADWTNATITLTPGTWLVIANIQSLYNTGASSGNNGYVRVSITDSANAVVQNMTKLISCKTVAAAANSTEGPIPFSFVANLSTSTTYKIRALRSDGAGTGSANLYNSSPEFSEFFAVRIA